MVGSGEFLEGGVGVSEKDAVGAVGLDVVEVVLAEWGRSYRPSRRLMKVL